MEFLEPSWGWPFTLVCLEAHTPSLVHLAVTKLVLCARMMASDGVWGHPDVRDTCLKR